MVHQPEDTRPQLCRNRLRDEGQAYPRSGCAICGNGGMMGCPHERRPSPPTTGSGVKPPPQPSAEAMVRVALEMSSRVLAAVEAERDAARAALATATAEAARLRAEVGALKARDKEVRIEAAGLAAVLCYVSASDNPEALRDLCHRTGAFLEKHVVGSEPLARAATAREG